MIIEKNLPFEICENCEKFVVDAEEQVISFPDKPSMKKLIVGCKNAWLCKQLKENFLKEKQNNG